MTEEKYSSTVPVLPYLRTFRCSSTLILLRYVMGTCFVRRAASVILSELVGFLLYIRK